MLNLIKKDLITSIKSEGKKNFKYVLLFIILYIILNPFSYYTFSIIVSYLILANSFYCDYENNSRNFIKSMPVSREDIVYSKYILGLGLILAITLISSIVNQLLSNVLFRGPVLNDVLLSINIFLIIISIVLPIFFKFGYHKVRTLGGFIGVIVFFISNAFLAAIAERVYQVKYMTLNPNHTFGNSVIGPFSGILTKIMNQSNPTYLNLYTVTIFVTLVFILSMYISTKIIKNNKKSY